MMAGTRGKGQSKQHGRNLLTGFFPMFSPYASLCHPGTAALGWHPPQCPGPFDQLLIKKMPDRHACRPIKGYFLYFYLFVYFNNILFYCFFGSFTSCNPTQPYSFPGPSMSALHPCNLPCKRKLLKLKTIKTKPDKRKHLSDPSGQQPAPLLTVAFSHYCLLFSTTVHVPVGSSFFAVSPSHIPLFGAVLGQAVYRSIQTAVLTNVHCKESLVWFKAPDFCYTISAGLSLNICIHTACCRTESLRFCSLDSNSSPVPTPLGSASLRFFFFLVEGPLR